MKSKFMKKVISTVLALAMVFSVAAVSAASVSAAPDNYGLSVGDKVLISKYSGTEVKIDGVEYTILK